MAEHEPYTFPGSPAMAVRMLCRGCGTTWPCLTSQIVRLTADLAAANATIAAQSLALATMREALEGAKIPHLEVDGDPWFSCCLSRGYRDYCLQHDDPKKPCPGYCTCGAADHNARIDAILAQPADAAAALAGAVLRAADAMERAGQ